MRRICASVALAVLPCWASSAADNELTALEKKDGWQLLFDGKTHAGWMTSGQKSSKTPVEEGCINPHGCGDYMMVYEKPLSNFILALDFKISKGCNSGIFVRTSSLTPRPGRDVGFNGIEIAVDDTKSSGYTDTGAIYDLSKPARNAMAPMGEWNHIVITSRGSEIVVELNGEKVNEVDLSKFTEPNKRPDGTAHKFDVVYRDHPASGYVGLQDHGSPCWYKNIKLKPLPGAVDIWGKTILRQPFDREPFREVRVPGWVEDTIGVGYTLSVMNPEQRKRAAAAGVTISEIGFVDPFYCYYESKFLSRRSPHVPPDRLENDIAEYRKLGVRLLGVYPPCLQGEVYEKHPEWRRIAENTTTVPQVDLKRFPHGGMLCLLGPYADFFIDVVAEITEKFHVDAWSFDGLHYAGVCYCQFCRTDYRKETGEEIPNVDMEDAAFRRYQHWADRRMERTVQKMQLRLKSIQPDVALVTWTTNAGRFGHFRDIPRNMPARMNLLFDAPDQEFWLDETNRGASIIPAIANAYIWAVTNHRVAFSEPYLMSHGNPYGKDGFPGHEVLRRMLLSVTYGVSPSIAVLQPENLQPAIFDALSEVQKRKPWLTHKSPEPWAALVLSDNTRVFYGRSSGQVEERYLANVFGFFRAAVEEHLPLTIINDWTLTASDLEAYKVLILANTACLNDEQVGAVKSFVANGGGLVASLDTSLYDDLGNPRADFALGETLGVRYAGIPAASGGARDEIDVNFAKGVDASYWQKRKSVFDLRCAAGSALDSPSIRTCLGSEPVTFKGPAVAVEPRGDGLQTAGTIEEKGEAGARRYPALLTRAFGKGKVVYLPAALDAAYYLYSYPYQRLILSQAIRWASASPPPVEVTAPMCVHAAVYRQTKSGERLVIHLYNDVNTTAFHAFPNDDVPLREEVIPIHDIRVRLRRGYPVGRVHLEPGGMDLAPRTIEGGDVEVIVPRIDVHAMVVVELIGK